jgi:hypothetical protein
LNVESHQAIRVIAPIRKPLPKVHLTSETDGRLITEKRLEGVAKASLQFEPNAGNCRRFCGASDDHHIIVVTAEWLEAKRVYLGAAKADPAPGTLDLIVITDVLGSLGLGGAARWVGGDKAENFARRKSSKRPHQLSRIRRLWGSPR